MFVCHDFVDRTVRLIVFLTFFIKAKSYARLIKLKGICFMLCMNTTRVIFNRLFLQCMYGGAI